MENLNDSPVQWGMGYFDHRPSDGVLLGIVGTVIHNGQAANRIVSQAICLSRVFPFIIAVISSLYLCLLDLQNLICIIARLKKIQNSYFPNILDIFD